MRREKIKTLCDCGGFWGGGGCDKKQQQQGGGAKGDVGCPVRGVIWGVQSEAFQQQLSPQRWMAEWHMCCSELDGPSPQDCIPL